MTGKTHSEDPADEGMLHTWEAAALLGVTRESLERMRRNSQGPAWIKVTGEIGKSGQVRYRRIDVEAYLTSRTVNPASARQPYDVPLPGLEDVENLRQNLAE